MTKETINELILELDEQIYYKNQKIKSLEQMYYVNGFMERSLEKEYFYKKNQINEKYNEEISNIFRILGEKNEEVRKKQPSLIELSEKNIKEKTRMPQRIALGKLKLKNMVEKFKIKDENGEISEEIYLPNLLKFPFNQNVLISDSK